MKKQRTKIGMTFGYGGTVWKIVHINGGHSDEFYNVITTEDCSGRRCEWSQGGLEYFLKTYPDAIILPGD